MKPYLRKDLTFGSEAFSYLRESIPERRACTWKALRQKHASCDLVTERQPVGAGQSGAGAEGALTRRQRPPYTGGPRGKSTWRRTDDVSECLKVTSQANILLNTICSLPLL